MTTSAQMLFEPFKLGSIELKNRIVMAPPPVTGQLQVRMPQILWLSNIIANAPRLV